VVVLLLDLVGQHLLLFPVRVIPVVRLAHLLVVLTYIHIRAAAVQELRVVTLTQIQDPVLVVQVLPHPLAVHLLTTAVVAVAETSLTLTLVVPVVLVVAVVVLLLEYTVVVKPELLILAVEVVVRQVQLTPLVQVALVVLASLSLLCLQTLLQASSQVPQLLRLTVEPQLLSSHLQGHTQHDYC
jgi:hypothetical protein